jgi:hypothetical protein
MTGTSVVARKRDGGLPPSCLLVDGDLAGQLLGRAQAGGAWSCSARMACCPR